MTIGVKRGEEVVKDALIPLNPFRDYTIPTSEMGVSGGEGRGSILILCSIEMNAGILKG